MDDADEWIMKTNSNLIKFNRRPLNKSEYYHFWGLILAISVGSESNRQSYWIEEYDSEFTCWWFQPHAFGSWFGMGIRRFEDILRCLIFWDDPSDRWCPICPFLMAINKRHQHSMIFYHSIAYPSGGWVIWKKDHTVDGIPHVTKIIRKSTGVGTEIKRLANLELQPLCLHMYQVAHNTNNTIVKEVVSFASWNSADIEN